MNKQLVIAELIFNAAKSVTNLAKQLPKTSKRGRNIFIKTYNRRPQNKKKRNLLIAQMALKTYLTGVQIIIEKSKPIPKYKTGV